MQLNAQMATLKAMESLIPIFKANFVVNNCGNFCNDIVVVVVVLVVIFVMVVVLVVYADKVWVILVVCLLCKTTPLQCY